MAGLGIALRGFGKALKEFSKNKRRVKDFKKGIAAGAGATLTGNVLGAVLVSKSKKKKKKLKQSKKSKP